MIRITDEAGKDEAAVLIHNFLPHVHVFSSRKILQHLLLPEYYQSREL